MTDEIEAAAEDDKSQPWQNESLLVTEWTEHAKPIDREWLESIGFKHGWLELSLEFGIDIGDGVVTMHAESSRMCSDHYRLPLPHITNRGQVIDLLRVLGKDVKP